MRPGWKPAEPTRRLRFGVAGVRLCIIASAWLLYPAIVGPDASLPTLAYGLLGLATLYGLVAWVSDLRPRAGPVAWPAANFVLDLTFVLLWLVATGGFASPFYVLLYVALVGVALHSTWKITCAATVLYAGAYVAMLQVLGDLVPNALPVALRVTYLFLAALLGVVLAREASDRATAAALMQRVAEAGTALSVERDRERAMKHVVDTARDLARASRGAVFLLDQATGELTCPYSSGLGPAYVQGVCRHYRALPGAAVWRDAPFVTSDDAQEDPRSPVLRDLARTEGFHALVALPLLIRGEVVGALALCRDSRRPFGERDLHVVAALAGHAAHAIEKAQLRREQERAAEVERQALEAAQETRRLSETSDFKTRFLNRAAHELNTPLTPIKLQLFRFRSGAFGGLSSTQLEATEVLDRNVDRLAALVTDILDIARIDGGKLALRRGPVPLRGIVQQTLGSFEAMARVDGVHLEMRDGEEVICDADGKRVSQVLYNLVSNAIRFTPAGGRVAVELSADEANAVVRVRDTGPGLSARQAALLFQPFSQVHAPAHDDRPGVGLGLHICKGIIEEHGGRIWIESDGPERGATFAFSVPLAPAPRPAGSGHTGRIPAFGMSATGAP